MTLSVLAIADDLTGALETGAKFAAAGFRAAVVTSPPPEPPSGVAVLVIDTETRHLTPAAAEDVVRRTAVLYPAAVVYKKTDSTLRGNIAAEFRALLEAFPGKPLVYAPAYPAMGRTVRAGCLYVDGVPVHRTAFADDLLNPVRDSRIAALLGGLPATVLDGETDADVEAAAEGIATTSPAPIAAGPAALAGALAAHLRLPRGPAPRWPRLPSCLIVNGSLHPASAVQVAHARTHLQPGWEIFEAATDAGAGLERAAAVGDAVAARLLRSPPDALAVFGGDTAIAIHRALGGAPFHPLGEIIPGVPISRCGGLHWITKAGGFGPPAILCDIQRQLL